MFVMDTLTRVLFYVFLAGTMLGIGLKVGKDELLSVVRDKNWLVRMLVANFLLIPAAGVLATRVLTMKPENALALILLACAPGGMGALQFLSKKKEAAALAYGGGTTVLLSFLSIVISPVLIALALPAGMTLTVPYGRAILFLSVFMLLPLIVGILVNGTSEAAASKLAGPVALIGTLAFVAVMVKLLVLTKWAKGEMGKRGIIGIILIILISMLIGWLLGGPRKFTRPVLATACSMRNIALAMAIAVRSFPGIGVLTPLVAFASIMVPANMLLMLIWKAAGRKAEKRAAYVHPHGGAR
jgi:bile acid:Na+ symporter, BASS family